MGRPLEFFLHMWATVLTHCFNLINNYEIGVILVFHEDVFIVDLKCAMTRPEMLKYIVYVHEDLH
jgi:hypothetical protein